MSDHPTASMTRAGAAALRPAEESDHAFVVALAEVTENAGLAPSAEILEPGFLTAVRRDTWANPMILASDDEDIAVAIIGAADTQHRHGRLVLLARHPALARSALSLYLRHAFWSHPLNRIYAVIPATAQGYGPLLESCGFQLEGRLQRHLRRGSKLVDLDMYGLLRSDFDTWCVANGRELAL